MQRRLIAIGDLHGDVHRLVRILERQDVLLAGQRKWAKSAGAVDVVLLGDYVDWRGEPLEGHPSTWERGVADLMELIRDLHRQVAEIRESGRPTRPRFIPLLGNHDKLMLDTYRYLSDRSPRERDAVAAAHTDVERLGKLLRPSLLGRILGGKQKDPLPDRVLTWMSNGGASTIRSFGGFAPWYERMKAGLAGFIEREMPLGVVINRRLYSHSVPDASRWWKPVADIQDLPVAERDEAVEEWVWGRRIYGIDYKTGQEVTRPAAADVDRMCAALGVDGVVVGHSLMKSLMPIKSYEGKVVNIDLHGHPLSEPWLDQYPE